MSCVTDHLTPSGASWERSSRLLRVDPIHWQEEDDVQKGTRFREVRMVPFHDTMGRQVESDPGVCIRFFCVVLI